MILCVSKTQQGIKHSRSKLHNQNWIDEKAMAKDLASLFVNRSGNKHLRWEDSNKRLKQ